MSSGLASPNPKWLLMREKEHIKPKLTTIASVKTNIYSMEWWCIDWIKAVFFYSIYIEREKNNVFLNSFLDKLKILNLEITWIFICYFPTLRFEREHYCKKKKKRTARLPEWGKEIKTFALHLILLRKIIKHKDSTPFKPQQKRRKKS